MKTLSVIALLAFFVLSLALTSSATGDFDPVQGYSDQFPARTDSTLRAIPLASETDILQTNLISDPVFYYDWGLVGPDVEDFLRTQELLLDLQTRSFEFSGNDYSLSEAINLVGLGKSRSINPELVITLVVLKQQLAGSDSVTTNWLASLGDSLWTNYVSRGFEGASELILVNGQPIEVSDSINAGSYALYATLFGDLFLSVDTANQAGQIVDSFVSVYSGLFGDRFKLLRRPAIISNNVVLLKPWNTSVYGEQVVPNSFFDHRYPLGLTSTVDCDGGVYQTYDDKLDKFDGSVLGPPANVCNCVLTSSCYDRHDGADFGRPSLPEGTEVYASATGTVLSVNVNQGGVVVGHDQGCSLPNCWQTRYWHLDPPVIGDDQSYPAVGSDVTAGQTVIGRTGERGNAIGPHLHFAVTHEGIVTDPYGWRSPNQDPWAAHPNGTVSECLWRFDCPGQTPVQVDVSLIIDSSGSMTWNDPSDMRKAGARVFVGTARNGDGLAVVDFDSSAFVRWPMTPLTNDRDAIYAAIDAIDSNGGTNIATGLQAGYTELQAGENNSKAAVLMTDGESPDPSSVVSQYVNAGWPIYTIGLGSGINQQMLQQIADATGGTYTQLSDPNDLIRVYFEIVGAILGGTTVFNQQYPMQQGETIQATVGVPANQSQVTFLVSWPGSRIDTTLTTPSGQQITPQTVDPNVYHAQGLTYELYRITNPESGDWTVSMYGADLPPGGEIVELTVNAIGQTTMAPTANAGGPYTGLVGQPVLFDGSASFDPDGSITLYEWDFDSDGTFDYSSSDPTATHTYGAPFNGTVTLRVTDNSGSTATGVASVTIEAALVCNDTPEGFDAGARAVGWTVLTGVAGGPEWTDLGNCGPYPNWTNGTGDAACVSAGNITLQPFDTELRTPMFSLAGYAEAYLNYQANYQNWASQDQLDLDISSDGGVTWATLRSWREDHGAPFSLPGENVTINLMSYVGESNLMVRWRYYAPSGQGLGYYAQLDEVRLNCTEIPPTAVTVSEMVSAMSQSPMPAASLPLAGLPAATVLAFGLAAWLRRKR